MSGTLLRQVHLQCGENGEKHAQERHEIYQRVLVDHNPRLATIIPATIDVISFITAAAGLGQCMQPRKRRRQY
jgi:hypothetical protein